MKLKTYDLKTTANHVPERKPSLSVSVTGTWRLNQAGVALVGVQAGDTLGLYQDETAPTEWYVAKSHSGFLVRQKERCMEFGSTITKKVMLASIGAEMPAGTMLLGTQPVKANGMLLWPVITSSLKYNPRQ